MRKFWQREDAAVATTDVTDRVPNKSAWASVPRWRLLATLLLAVLNAGLSAALLLQHHGDARGAAAVSQVCGTGAESGCETVNKSPYSSVRGVPLAAIGLAFSLSLALLCALGLLGGPDTRAAASAIALGLLGLSLVAAVVLLGVQVFLIKAFCKLCLLTYAVDALAFMLMWPTRRRGASLGAGFRYSEGRIAIAGWGLGTLAVAGGVLACDMALAARASAGSGASPLGMAAAPSVPPAPAGTDARRYQDEALRLQGILDDPKKLEDYFTEKANRQYEQAPVQSFDLRTTPSKGNATAPVKVVAFSDFLCPYCRSIAGAFANYFPQAADRAVLYFKNYPLDQACNPHISRTVHPGACNLALGAVCAQEQGKFWPYHDRVFQAPPSNPGPAEVTTLAVGAGLDGPALAACMDGAGAKQRLAAELLEGKQGDVSGTPAVFINGRQIPRMNDFVQTVDKEAAKAGLKPLGPPSGPPAAPPH